MQPLPGVFFLAEGQKKYDLEKKVFSVFRLNRGHFFSPISFNGKVEFLQIEETEKKSRIIGNWTEATKTASLKE